MNYRSKMDSTENKEPVKLRPHHVILLINNWNDAQAIINQQVSDDITECIYGSRFMLKIKNLRKDISPKTKVVLVPGQDYICEELPCPYLEICRTGDYDSIDLAMQSRLDNFEVNSRYHAMALHAFRDAIGTIDPAALDSQMVKKYGLHIGKTYDWENLAEKYTHPKAKHNAVETFKKYLSKLPI